MEQKLKSGHSSSLSSQDRSMLISFIEEYKADNRKSVTNDHILEIVDLVTKNKKPRVNQSRSSSLSKPRFWSPPRLSRRFSPHSLATLRENFSRHKFIQITEHPSKRSQPTMVSLTLFFKNS